MHVLFNFIKTSNNYLFILLFISFKLLFIQYILFIVFPLPQLVPDHLHIPIHPIEYSISKTKNQETKQKIKSKRKSKQKQIKIKY